MRVVLHAGILFIIAYLTYFAKVGNNQPPSLLRKIIALYAFNTAVVEVGFWGCGFRVSCGRSEYVGLR